MPITGTASPDAQVQLFVRRAGDAHFAAGKTVIADSSGNHGTTLRIIRTSHYYVRSNNDDSPRVTTAQYEAKCSVGGPIVDHLPLGPSQYADPQDSDFVALTASRGATWAGVTARDSSVQVAGITPRGAVVASVQAREHGSSTPRLSYVWVAGVAQRLAGPSDWTFVQATGVSDDGTIVGTARVHESDGHYVYRAVAWSHDGARVVLERATGNIDPSPVIGQDDIAYFDRNGIVQLIDLLGGTHELLSPAPFGSGPPTTDDVFPESASDNAVFGSVQQADTTWTVPNRGGDDPIVGHTVGEPLFVFDAESRGDSVVCGFHPNSLRLITGSVSDLPHQPSVTGTTAPVSASRPAVPSRSPPRRTTSRTCCAAARSRPDPQRGRMAG